MLQDWCRHHGAECLAVQLPGRGMRAKEPFLPSLQEAARQLLPVVASLLQDTPYIVCSPGFLVSFLFVWEGRIFIPQVQ